MVHTNNSLHTKQIFNHFKFFQGSLPQILLGSFLNALSQLKVNLSLKWIKVIGTQAKSLWPQGILGLLKNSFMEGVSVHSLLHKLYEEATNLNCLKSLCTIAEPRSTTCFLQAKLIPTPSQKKAEFSNYRTFFMKEIFLRKLLNSCRRIYDL